MEQAPRSVYLIGICGTAMASLAGLLRAKGHRVRGSDAAAYPPMSSQLAAMGVAVAQPYSADNLEPRPDLVVVGNAISRGNVELERVLNQRIPFTSMADVLHREFLSRPCPDRDRRHSWQDHHHLHARLDLSLRQPRSLLPDRRRRRELLHQLSMEPQRPRLHPRRRRVRHRVLRQGPQVPPLLSRGAHPHLGRVRSRRYLSRSRRRQDRVQAAGQPRPAARAHRRLRRQQQRHRMRRPRLLSGRALRLRSRLRMAHSRHRLFTREHRLVHRAPRQALGRMRDGSRRRIQRTQRDRRRRARGRAGNPPSPPSLARWPASAASSAASKCAPGSTASPSSTISRTTPPPSPEPSRRCAPATRARGCGWSSSLAPIPCAATSSKTSWSMRSRSPTRSSSPMSSSPRPCPKRSGSLPRPSSSGFGNAAALPGSFRGPMRSWPRSPPSSAAGMSSPSSPMAASERSTTSCPQALQRLPGAPVG